MWENTVLVLTSDHGEAMGERGVNGHRAHYPYDELLQVPLLVRIPGSDGRRVGVPFSLSWLHELLAEILDIEPMALPSRSPSETHLDDPTDGRLVVTDALSPFGHTVVVRDRRNKLIKHFDGRVPSDPNRRYALMKRLGIHTTDFGPEVFEALNTLYRPLTDPCERIPLAESNAPPEHHERAQEIRTASDDIPPCRWTTGRGNERTTTGSRLRLRAPSFELPSRRDRFRNSTNASIAL